MYNDKVKTFKNTNGIKTYVKDNAKSGCQL